MPGLWSTRPLLLTGSAPNEQPCGWGGQPLGIVGQQDAANQILARYNLSPGVGVLVPYLPEAEAFAGLERKEPERTEHRLTSKPGPDRSLTGVGNSKVGGRSASEQLQRERRPAGIGDGKHQRHRLAA